MVDNDLHIFWFTEYISGVKVLKGLQKELEGETVILTRKTVLSEILQFFFVSDKTHKFLFLSLTRYLPKKITVTFRKLCVYCCDFFSFSYGDFDYTNVLERCGRPRFTQVRFVNHKPNLDTCHGEEIETVHGK